MDKSKKSVYKYFIAINMMRRSRPSHLASLVLHGRTVQGLKDRKQLHSQIQHNSEELLFQL